jgi:hypothetical protein
MSERLLLLLVLAVVFLTCLVGGLWLHRRD